MKFDQKKYSEEHGLDLDNLQSQIKPIQPSTNKVTKKEIMSILSKKQKELVKFYLESKEDNGLTIQHLDPRQNRYNSVRYQYLLNSGHFIGKEITVWNCHQECDFFCTQPVVYFVSFGDSKPTLCIDDVKRDDISGIGSRASTGHLFDNHPDFVKKRLKNMGEGK